jgi:hypothetical protein
MDFKKENSTLDTYNKKNKIKLKIKSITIFITIEQNLKLVLKIYGHLNILKKIC